MTEEKSVFHEHLQRAGLKRTAQRDLILDVFVRTEEHMSSEDLYNLVKQEDPTVGHTTVYRTLKLLVEAGLAREVRFGDGRTRYEHNYKHPHHDHMICTGCGLTVEFFSAELEAMQDEIMARHGFRPIHHSLRLFGHCSKCKRESGQDDEKTTSTAEPRVRFANAPGTH